MAAKSDYVTGTITLTNGSTAFTGAGTGWLLAGFAEGDEIKQVEGQTQWEAMVQSITDNTHGTLVRPWGGATGTYAYRLRYQADGQRVTAQARSLIELLGDGTLLSLAGLSGPGVIELLPGGGAQVVPKTDLMSGANYDVQVANLAARAAYDGQATGYAVLVADAGSGRAAIFSKNSATSADWSAPAYVTGPEGAASTVPGPTGPGTTPRGPYSGVTTYAINDLATYNGSTFRKLTTAAAGTAPSSASPPVDTAAWEVWSRKGTDGAGTVTTIVAGDGVAVENTDPTHPVVGLPPGGGADLRNLGLAFSVASSALTITLKQADGATNPAAGNGAVKVKMRSATAGSGAVIDRSVQAALSLAIPSTATMGRTNALVGHLYHYLIDNAGTLELAVSGKFFGVSGIVTTTTISTAADSYDVMYSTTGRANVPFRLIGRSIDTQTTAGTWAAVPSLTEIGPTKPWPVSFLAYLGATQNVVSGGSGAVVLFNQEESDVGGFFDSVTASAFRPPAGEYIVGATGYLQGGASGFAMELDLMKNGALELVISTLQMASASSPFISGSAKIAANGSDYYQVLIYQNTGSTRSVYNSGKLTQFWGTRVGD